MYQLFKRNINSKALQLLNIYDINIPWLNMTAENEIWCLQTSLRFPHSLHRQWQRTRTIHLLHLQFFRIPLHTLFLLPFARFFTMEFMRMQPKGFFRSQLAENKRSKRIKDKR